MDLTGSGNETAGRTHARGRTTNDHVLRLRARPRYCVSMVTGGCCGGRKSRIMRICLPVPSGAENPWEPVTSCARHRLRPDVLRVRSPFFDYVGERPSLPRWAEAGKAGLGGLSAGEKHAQHRSWSPRPGSWIRTTHKRPLTELAFGSKRPTNTQTPQPTELNSFPPLSETAGSW